MGIVDEMGHVDYLVVCYRPRHQPTDEELEILRAKLMMIHHPILGAYDQLIEWVSRYNETSGLQIAFKYPVTSKGLKYVIASVAALLNRP